jgi:hypothetical protein
MMTLRRVFMGVVVMSSLCLAACAAGTGPAVRGRVVDRDTGGGVENAKVLFKSEAGAWAALTDRRGEFQLNVPPGVYQVYFAYREALSSEEAIEVGTRGAEVDGMIDVPVVWSRSKAIEHGKREGDPLVWLPEGERDR